MNSYKILLFAFIALTEPLSAISYLQYLGAELLKLDLLELFSCLKYNLHSTVRVQYQQISKYSHKGPYSNARRKVGAFNIKSNSSQRDKALKRLESLTMFCDLCSKVFKG